MRDSRAWRFCCGSCAIWPRPSCGMLPRWAGQSCGPTQLQIFCPFSGRGFFTLFFFCYFFQFGSTFHKWPDSAILSLINARVSDPDPHGLTLFLGAGSGFVSRVKSWIRIRIEVKCWIRIRIRIKVIRIRNPCCCHCMINNGSYTRLNFGWSEKCM